MNNKYVIRNRNTKEWIIVKHASFINKINILKKSKIEYVKSYCEASEFDKIKDALTFLKTNELNKNDYLIYKIRVFVEQMNINEEKPRKIKHSIFKDEEKIFKSVPIIIIPSDENVGYRVEIPDNYMNYKPAKYSDLNFEDLNFHFNLDDDRYIFTKEEALETAQCVIDRGTLAKKCKIWLFK